LLFWGFVAQMSDSLQRRFRRIEQMRSVKETVA